MLKVLVAGGAGFIGSHLIKKLLDLGHFIYCLDNLSTGSLVNIKKYIDNPNFEFINHDIINPIPHYQIDLIYNLACPASPIHYQMDPIKTMKTSVLGTYNIIDLALLENAKIIFSSTSEIYGDPLEHPQKETYWGHVNPIGIRSCYDEGKRCSETILLDFHKFQKLNISIARIFNTYGPNMMAEDGRVVSNFIISALNNKDIVINGDGRQTRSFCYVDDTVKALISLASLDDVGPFNIGNPNEITIKELSEIIIRLTNSKSEISFVPLPEDDPLKRKPDISKAKNKFGWKPSVNLEDGLKKTISFFNK
tara:strand:+ start:990 stop:1913 length:924 start_codon:yes stop_codon:yes gene_type:complete